MVFDDWARGLSEKEITIIAQHDHRETVAPWPVSAKRRVAWMLAEKDLLAKWEASGRRGREKAKRLRECRANKCHQTCEIYLGQACVHLGGRKIPRMKTLGGMFHENAT